MTGKTVMIALPWVLFVIAIVIFVVLPSCASRPDSGALLQEYQKALSERQGTPSANKEAVSAFTNFLQNIDDKSFVEKQTAEIYAPDAYLNDTLVTHHGPEEIKAYFLETADTMESYEVAIDDIASNGQETYVRWTMKFTAPLLNGGKPVESPGMSHVRFDEKGQVIMHQDFWDSGTNIYGQLPMVGGIIGTIRRRFE